MDNSLNFPTLWEFVHHRFNNYKNVMHLKVHVSQFLQIKQSSVVMVSILKLIFNGLIWTEILNSILFGLLLLLLLWTIHIISNILVMGRLYILLTVINSVILQHWTTMQIFGFRWFCLCTISYIATICINDECGIVQHAYVLLKASLYRRTVSNSYV